MNNAESCLYMNVLLFGGGLQVLSVARSLKEMKRRVYVAGENNEVSRFCRYVDDCRFIDLSLIQVADFVRLINEFSISVVIPMEDEYATWLSKNKDEVENSCVAKCAIMNHAIYSLASDKTRLLDFCKVNNLPHPRTMLINDNYEELAEYVGFPSLVKPNHAAGARGISLVNSIDELKIVAKSTIKEYGDCALQEFIGGRDYYYNVMLYRTKEGAWANYAITKIIRYYPINGGSSSFCYTIENDALLNVCKEVLEKLNWIGFADFDVLEKNEGEYKIIEINPRIPASVKAAAVSGVNFAEIIVCDLCGDPIPVYRYTPGKQLRYLGLDIAWVLASPKRWKASPNWFRFVGKDLHYQDGGIHDILAMFMSMWVGFKKMINPQFMKRKKGLNTQI